MFSQIEGVVNSMTVTLSSISSIFNINTHCSWRKLLIGDLIYLEITDYSTPVAFSGCAH